LFLWIDLQLILNRHSVRTFPRAGKKAERQGRSFQDDISKKEAFPNNPEPV
jgi:hypothetical protein